MNEISILKKKIIYIAQHRGIKEMDILLSEFVKKYLDELTSIELNDLYEFLQHNDNNIFDWYNNKISLPSNSITSRLKNSEFKF